MNSWSDFDGKRREQQQRAVLSSDRERLAANSPHQYLLCQTTVCRRTEVMVQTCLPLPTPTPPSPPPLSPPTPPSPPPCSGQRWRIFYHRLRRVLRGLAHLFPDVGYCQASIVNDQYENHCQSFPHHNRNENHDQYADNLLVQGMGMIAASLLLFLKEDDTFWMMACIVQVK